MFKKGTIVSILTVALMILVIGVATAEDLKPIVFTVEGAFFIAGEADQAIADAKEQLESDALSADKVKDAKGRIHNMELMQAFMNKAGYTLVGEDWGWAEQLQQKQTAAFLAGTGPDLMIGETQMPGYAQSGYLEPFPEWLADKVKEKVVLGAYKPMMVDGKIYGIATYPGVNVLFWNKDLLRKAGLDPDKAPETWAELLSNANKITEAGNREFWGGGTYAGPNFGGSLRVGPFMKMTGGGFVDKDNNIIFDHPGNVQALEYIRKLDKNVPPGLAAAPGEGGFWDALMQGRIAYAVDGPWRYPQAETLGLDFGYSTLPVPEDGNPANVTIGAAFYGIPTYSDNKEGAWKFIEALIDPEVQENVKESQLRPPVLKSFGDDPEFQKTYIYTFYKSLASGDVSGLPTYNKSSAKVWDVFHQAMSKAVVTNMSIEQILEKAQSQAEAIQE